ncbi:MAG: hypothetical protein JWL88_399 [Parcubacteria group bacterium]|nr:hypothetical protein [Parcubacteria group bacterium]
MGSAREGRIADKIAKLVSDEIRALGAEPVLADLQQINMPFFNNPMVPISEGYSTSEPSVLAWSTLVKESDSVVLITPEYNRGTTALLKNAIDWLGVEWHEKPVAIIGYGWSGGSLAIGNVIQSMNQLKAALFEDTASLFFMKSIGVDGEPIGDEAKLMVQPLLKAFVG